MDDDPLVLKVLRSLLEPWGIAVTGLDAPQQFWQVLKATQPEVVTDRRVGKKVKLTVVLCNCLSILRLSELHNRGRRKASGEMHENICI